MPLVDYSDSEASGPESDQNSSRQQSHTTKASFKHASDDEAPELPAGFHDLYASNVRASTSDDPSLHGGRQRQIPHVEGNWPTHLYIEWVPTTNDAPRLAHLLEQANKTSTPRPGSGKLHSLLKSDLAVPLPLHISLSRPIILRAEQIDPFLRAVEDQVQNANVAPFIVRTGSLGWVANFDRTRWFLVLRLDPQSEEDLDGLLTAINQAIRLVGQPTLDRPNQLTGPRPEFMYNFHVSIAWTLEQPTSDLARLAAQAVPSFLIDVSRLKVKIGNNVHSTSFSRSQGNRLKSQGYLGN